MASTLKESLLENLDIVTEIEKTKTISIKKDNMKKNILLNFFDKSSLKNKNIAKKSITKLYNTPLDTVDIDSISIVNRIKISNINLVGFLMFCTDKIKYINNIKILKYKTKFSATL